MGTSGSSVERAERALVGEDDGEFAVLRMLDVEANALMAFGRGARRAQQQLTAHAEVRDERLVGRSIRVGRFQRDPQELAAPRGASQDAAGERGLELGARAGVAGQRALVQHGDAEHGRAGDGGVEARTHDLDFRKFRHAR